MEEFKERAELIEEMLDKIKPIPKGVPRKVKEQIDTERQLLALRAGWTNMPIEELRKTAGKEIAKSTFSITVAKPKIVKLEFENQVFGNVVELTSLATSADKASLARVILWGADVIHSHNENQETYVHERGVGEISWDYHKRRKANPGKNQDAGENDLRIAQRLRGNFGRMLKSYPHQVNSVGFH